MPLQTRSLNWTRSGTDQRLCTVNLYYDFETGEGAARKLSNTKIVIKFYQAHDVTDSYEEIATAIRDFAETMFEEAAVEVAV